MNLLANKNNAKELCWVRNKSVTNALEKACHIVNVSTPNSVTVWNNYYVALASAYMSKYQIFCRGQHFPKIQDLISNICICPGKSNTEPYITSIIKWESGKKYIVTIHVIKLKCAYISIVILLQFWDIPTTMWQYVRS